jgi:hypothetical protein
VRTRADLVKRAIRISVGLDGDQNRAGRRC